ncbi:hypothetical protein HZB93_00150 [Candidatus Falkowbacteria bacterium]|nr:hypothetical protein [Candidatus Falkowbacteria bacterium]
MAEYTRRGFDGKERTVTGETILEETLRYKFAEYPLTVEEIETIINDLKKEGVSAEVGQVIREVLKDKVRRHGDYREIESLVAFCEKHGISYDADFSAEEVEKLNKIFRDYKDRMSF